jgi:hypothetical protein
MTREEFKEIFDKHFPAIVELLNLQDKTIDIYIKEVSEHDPQEKGASYTKAWYGKYSIDFYANRIKDEEDAISTIIHEIVHCMWDEPWDSFVKLTINTLKTGELQPLCDFIRNITAKQCEETTEHLTRIFLNCYEGGKYTYHHY